MRKALKTGGNIAYKQTGMTPAAFDSDLNTLSLEVTLCGFPVVALCAFVTSVLSAKNENVPSALV